MDLTLFAVYPEFLGQDASSCHNGPLWFNNTISAQKPHTRPPEATYTKNSRWMEPASAHCLPQFVKHLFPQSTQVITLVANYYARCCQLDPKFRHHLWAWSHSEPETGWGLARFLSSVLFSTSTSNSIHIDTLELPRTTPSDSPTPSQNLQPPSFRVLTEQAGRNRGTLD